jgi:hypothetical protein
VFTPGESPVKVQPKILDIFFLRQLYIIYMYRRARFCVRGKCYINRFGFVGLYSPFLTSPTEEVNGIAVFSQYVMRNKLHGADFFVRT